MPAQLSAAKASERLRDSGNRHSCPDGPLLPFHLLDTNDSRGHECCASARGALSTRPTVRGPDQIDVTSNNVPNAIGETLEAMSYSRDLGATDAGSAFVYGRLLRWDRVE